MDDSVPLCIGKTVLMTRDHLEYDCFLWGPLDTSCHSASVPQFATVSNANVSVHHSNRDAPKSVITQQLTEEPTSNFLKEPSERDCTLGFGDF